MSKIYKYQQTKIPTVIQVIYSWLLALLLGNEEVSNTFFCQCFPCIPWNLMESVCSTYRYNDSFVRSSYSIQFSENNSLTTRYENSWNTIWISKQGHPVFLFFFATYVYPADFLTVVGQKYAIICITQIQVTGVFVNFPSRRVTKLRDLRDGLRRLPLVWGKRRGRIVPLPAR